MTMVSSKICIAEYTPFDFITIIFIKNGGWKYAKIKNFLRITLRLKSSSRLRIFLAHILLSLIWVVIYKEQL